MSYGYDSGSELTGITYTNGSTTLGTLTYAHDLAGRRTSVGGSYAATGLPNAISSTAYDAANELTTWGTATPTYDSNGNTTSDGTNSYVWNARNELASMNSGGATFQYDPFGRRVAKTIISTTTNYLYDGANPVQELAGTTPTANLLTGAVDEYFTRTDSSGTANFLTDALGSTLALTDGGGSTLASYTYEPFGNTTTSGSSASTYQYTGRENDGTGVYFYRARYYSPTLQRFVSEDPLGFRAGSSNFYTYAYGSPANFIDPYGLEGCDATCQAQIGQLVNLFPGSQYNGDTLVIPQNTQSTEQTLQNNGYQNPGQWWNPFLYWDPIAHAGGDEFRKGLQPGSFHFRKQYPPCPFGAFDSASCFMWQHTMAGRKTTLDQFHIDRHDPAVDPKGHLLNDVFHLPEWVDYYPF